MAVNVSSGGLQGIASPAWLSSLLDAVVGIGTDLDLRSTLVAWSAPTA
jgi:hypothetical protein